MTHPHDIPTCDDHNPFDWDADEIRDLVRTTPLRYDDGLPVGYEADQLFGLEAAYGQ